MNISLGQNISLLGEQENRRIGRKGEKEENRRKGRKGRTGRKGRKGEREKGEHGAEVVVGQQTLYFVISRLVCL